MDVTNAIPEYRIIAPKESIISWKNDPITRQVLEIVAAEKIESSIRLGSGETLGDNIVQATSRGVGYIEGLGFLESLLDLTDIVDNKEDKDE